ncbi:hypothetical protein PSTT_01497, partial [Puccinia striiformis]
TYASPPPGYLTPQWPGLYGPNSDPYLWDVDYMQVIRFGEVEERTKINQATIDKREKKGSFRYDRNNGKRRKPSKETMLNNNKRKKTSVGTIIHQEEEWIPLNRHRRASSIITTIHHPSKQNLYKSIRRPFASIFLIPTFFFVIFSFSAIISGSLVGWAIAALYNAAFLRMSTWVPALWSAGLTLIVIISSYSNISTVLILEKKKCEISYLRNPFVKHR